MNTESVTTEFQEIKTSGTTAMQEVAQRRDALIASPITNKARNIFFLAGILGLSLTFVLFAFQILAGLAAMVATCVVGVSLWLGSKHIGKLDAVVRQKAELAMLSTMIKTAQKNHVIQLKAAVLKKREKIAAARAKYVELRGQVEQLRIKANRAEKDDPYAQQKLEMYEKTNAATARYSKLITRMSDAADKFERQVNFYEDMAKTAAIASNIMEALADNKLDDMLSMAAFEQIELEYCTVMAELDELELN